MNGAVMPAKISKFRPSNVMSWGTALFKYSQNSTSSTGTRTTFR